jgi:hypothetical protein
MDLPILGATGPSGPNGGGQLAAIDRKYAVELATADGGLHTLTIDFARPTGADGIVNLGALKNFDPKTEVMSQVGRLVACAQLGILAVPGDKTPPVIVKVEGGAVVVWKHVVSIAFLGEWDPATEDVVGA